MYNIRASNGDDYLTSSLKLKVRYVAATTHFQILHGHIWTVIPYRMTQTEYFRYSRKFYGTLTARLWGESAETFSSDLTCTVWWQVIDAWPDVTGPLPMSGLCVCQRPSRMLTFSSKEEVGRIWKMELLKESDGLGIQVSGGRGSKRSPHAIVVTQVKEGGAAHRWLVTLPHPSVSLLPLPPSLRCWVFVPFAWSELW